MADLFLGEMHFKETAIFDFVESFRRYEISKLFKSNQFKYTEFHIAYALSTSSQERVMFQSALALEYLIGIFTAANSINSFLNN